MSKENLFLSLRIIKSMSRIGEHMTPGKIESASEFLIREMNLCTKLFKELKTIFRLK